MLEPVCGSKIRTPWVRDRRNADPTMFRRQVGHALKPFDARHAERFGIGHHVGLACLQEVASTEITSDANLMFDRPLQSRAEITGPHRFFLIGQPHLLADHSGGANEWHPFCDLGTHQLGENLRGRLVGWRHIGAKFDEAFEKAFQLQ
jgi:hypothetical protein